MKKWLRILTAFLFGVLVGSSLMLFRIGPDYEKIISENSRLQNANEDLTRELDELREQNEKRQQKKAVVEDVVVLIAGKEKDPNPLELEVQKKARKDVEWLIGQSVSSVMELHEGIHTVFKNRSYTINDKKVIVQLKTLMISEKMYLYLELDIENN